MEGGEAGQGEEESVAQPVQTAREIKRRLVVNNFKKTVSCQTDMQTEKEERESGKTTLSLA